MTALTLKFRLTLPALFVAMGSLALPMTARASDSLCDQDEVVATHPPHAATDGCKDAHSCMIKSNLTPSMADGTPIFGRVWRFMYGAAADPED